MTAAIAPRDTKKYQNDTVLAIPQKGSTKVFKGTLVVAQAGYAKPGATGLGLIALGRASKTSDNTSGADGAKTVEVEAGIFRWANGDGITQADVGKSAWIVDDSTVSKASTGKSKAGLIVAVDSAGVWVATFPNMADQDSVELAALVTDLASTATGKGASLIGLEDADGNTAETDVEGALAEIYPLVHAAPAMQAVNATLASGTITIASGIVVAADSEVIPLVIGAITGSTNFGSLGELKASRVAGDDGVGTVVIQAYGADGALDADAAGAIRVLILTPQ